MNRICNWPKEDVNAHYARLREKPRDEAPPPPKKRKPVRRKTLTEREIERQIIDLLEAHGWLVLRTNIFGGAVIQRQGSIEPGIPDLMARRPYPYSIPLYRILWIEVKRPDKEMSAVQWAWYNAALRRGETVMVARSVEDVAAAIGVKL